MCRRHSVAITFPHAYQRASIETKPISLKNRDGSLGQPK